MLRPPMTDAEIWHTAWLMAALFGCTAEAQRAAMNHARLVQGSPQGEEAWRRVAGVLKEIRSQKLTRAVH